jgi:hypothetical protein
MYEVEVDDKPESIPYSNSTAIAVFAIGQLCLPYLNSRPMLDSFLKPGGIPALVRLLNESSWPQTLQHTATVVIAVLGCWGLPPVRRDWAFELANKFYNAGEPGRGSATTCTRQNRNITCETFRR